MAGVGNKLLLRLHVFEIRRDGSPGKEDHKTEHHQKARGSNSQRDPQQRPHGLYLPLRVEKQHNRFIFRRADKIPIATFIAVHFSAFQHCIRIGFGITFGDGRDKILIHSQNFAI